MTGRSKVSGHTRATASGKRTKVRPHTRKGGLVTPRHSWSLFRRAVRAGRRGRKVTACVLGGLALAELVACLALTGTAVILATAAVLAGTTAFLAAQAGGMAGTSPRRKAAGGGTKAAEQGTSPEFRRMFLGGGK